MMTKALLKKERLLSLCFTLLLSTPSWAIDNPDAKNFVAEWEANAKPYKQAIDNPSNGNRATLSAYTDYQQFLDGELNKAYLGLKNQLSAERQKELANSQQQWLIFRDSEFLLIENTWTRDNFGSSAAISRGTYRCALLENRIRQLLAYSANY